MNPAVAFRAGDNTRIDVGYEYFHDRRTADRGVPSVAGEPLEGFDRTFFGDPGDSYAKANVNVVNFGIEHELADRLTIKNHTMFGDYDKFYQNIFAGVRPHSDSSASRSGSAKRVQ